MPGVRLDTGTTMAALGACRAGKQWQLASSIFDSARAKEVEPSLVLFNAILGVYAAAQQVGRVEWVGGWVGGWVGESSLVVKFDRSFTHPPT